MTFYYKWTFTSIKGVLLWKSSLYSCASSRYTVVTLSYTSSLPVPYMLLSVNH